MQTAEPQASANVVGGEQGDEYHKALAGRDARITELEGEKIAEAAKTAEAAEKLRAEMDELRRQGEGHRVGFELRMAGRGTPRRSKRFSLTARATSRSSGPASRGCSAPTRQPPRRRARRGCRTRALPRTRARR